MHLEHLYPELLWQRCIPDVQKTETALCKVFQIMRLVAVDTPMGKINPKLGVSSLSLGLGLGVIVNPESL